MKSEQLRELELKNSAGFRVGLLDYGALIRSISMPVAGRHHTVVLGFPNPLDYLQDVYYLGATIGRYAGRIDRGQFQLNGHRYQLAMEGEVHCLHGGPDGFSRQYWSVDNDPDSQSVVFRYESSDGEQGFPGGLVATTTYSLQGDFGLLIEYLAESDADTVINLSNHAYFNLNGSHSAISNHEIVINANRYACLGLNSIPTGELRGVDNSRFDFREPCLLADRIRPGGSGPEYGFDHSFEINRSTTDLTFAASAKSPATGIWLKVHTTQPTVHFYSGDFLEASALRSGGLCFEAQNFPDAPNKPGFPSAVLKPGQVYAHKILYEFGFDDDTDVRQ